MDWPAPATKLKKVGVEILLLLLGLGRTKEVVYANDVICARQAEQYAVVNKVVTQEELNKKAVDTAMEIAYT